MVTKSRSDIYNMFFGGIFRVYKSIQIYFAGTRYDPLLRCDPFVLLGQDKAHNALEGGYRRRGYVRRLRRILRGAQIRHHELQKIIRVKVRRERMAG